MVESYRPSDLAEALAIRRRSGALPFAGGTDLMVKYRAKNGLDAEISGPVLFVDGIREMREISFDGPDLLIGGALPVAVIADDPGERAAWAESGAGSPESLQAIPELLRAAAADLGAPALRQRATIAGNVANASPAGDTVAALYALRAELVCRSVDASRSVPIESFITGPGKHNLKDDELISAIRIPEVSGHRWSYWRKVGTRRANALTKVSLALSAAVDKGQVGDLRLAFGAVGPTVVTVPEAAALLSNRTPSQWELPSVAEILRTGITPIDDQRSTAHYRQTVAVNLAKEALAFLAAYIKENTQ